MWPDSIARSARSSARRLAAMLSVVLGLLATSIFAQAQQYVDVDEAEAALPTPPEAAAPLQQRAYTSPIWYTP